MADETQPKKKSRKGLWITLIIIGFAIIGLASTNSSKNSSNSSSQPSATNQNVNTQQAIKNENKATTQGLAIGEEGILNAGNGVDPIFLAVDEDSFDSLSKALLANDTEGIIELANQEKVFGVSSGSKVKVIDQKTFIRKIRILEGIKSIDTDKVGLAGWVPFEWVVKQ